MYGISKTLENELGPMSKSYNAINRHIPSQHYLDLQWQHDVLCNTNFSSEYCAIASCDLGNFKIKQKGHLFAKYYVISFHSTLVISDSIYTEMQDYIKTLDLPYKYLKTIREAEIAVTYILESTALKFHMKELELLEEKYKKFNLLIRKPK